jgi:hypothetical protein
VRAIAFIVSSIACIAAFVWYLSRKRPRAFRTAHWSVAVGALGLGMGLLAVSYLCVEAGKLPFAGLYGQSYDTRSFGFWLMVEAVQFVGALAVAQGVFLLFRPSSHAGNRR